MSPFTGLVRKEFRDHVAVLAVCAAFGPAISWPVQHWVFKYAEPLWTAEFLVPCLVAIFVLLLASDLFAQDVTTRRMDAFALLPVPLRTHWMARVTFLAVSGSALAAWTWAFQALLLATLGRPGIVGEFVVADDGPLLGFAVVGLVGAGALVCSAMGVGGVRAALFGAGLAIVSGVSAGVLTMATEPGVSAVDSLRMSEPTLAPLLLATAVLVVAGYTAFVRGRPHVASRRCVLAWGLSPVLLLVVPGAALAGMKIHDQLTLEPGAPNVEVRGIDPSPDGRHLVLRVGPRDVWNSFDRTWVVRVEDGALSTWSGRGEQFAGWTKDSLVATYRLAFFHPADEQEAADLEVHQPDTGETVRAWAVADWSSGEVSSSMPGNTWMRWNSYPSRSEGDWQLGHRDGTNYEKLWSRGMPAPCAEAPCVLAVTGEGALVRVDLATRASTTLVAKGIVRTCGFRALSNDGRFLLVEMDGGSVALDTSTWTVAAGPWKDRAVSWSYKPGNGAAALLSEPKTGTLLAVVDVASRRETPVGTGVGGDWSDVAPLADRRVAVTRDDASVDLLAADGTLIRRLYPPAK